MDVERIEEVLIMVAITKTLPTMDISISKTLRTQFMMSIASGVKLSLRQE